MKGYIKGLDGVRAIAVILVMSFHYGLTWFGWIGVQLFFVLSGFLITGILWRAKYEPEGLSFKFKKFWIRRSLRIFPLYFGYLFFLGVAYLLFHFPSYYKLFFPYLLTYTFNYTRNLAGWVHNPLFTHLWSLSIEEQFYLLFPLFIFLCPARLIKFMLLLIIVITPVTRLLLGDYYIAKGLAPDVVADSVYWNTLSHLDAFCMGGAIPVLALDRRIRKPQWLCAGSLLLLLAAGAWNFLHQSYGHSYFGDLGYKMGEIAHDEHIWHYTCLNLFFSSFILLMVSVHSQGRLAGMRRLLESKWLVRIGKVSYGMYLFHWAIMVYFYKRIFPGGPLWQDLLLFIPYVVLVYLLAELSFRVYESRFLVWKERLTERKAVAAEL